MSLIRAKAIQMGYDATASNNFLIYQPLTPDGTFRIAVGNQGASTDIMTVSSAGSVTFAGSTNFASLNFGSGTESAPSLYPTGDSNTGIWFPAADTFAVSTGGTQRLRVDAAGQLGLGVTPSTWDSNSKALEFAQGSLMGYGTTSMNLFQNAYLNASTVNTYKQSSLAASGFSLASGGFNWKTAASGTAGNPITWNQIMTLNSAGDWKLGTTGYTTKATIFGANAATGTTVTGTENALLLLVNTDSTASAGPEIAFASGYDGGGVNTVTGAAIKSSKTPGAGSGSDQYNHSLVFKTSNYSLGLRETMRLDENGFLLLGSSGNAGGGKLDLVSNTGANSAIQARSTSAGTGDGTASVTVTRAVTNGAQWWANARYDAYSHAWGYGGSATGSTAMFIDGTGKVGIGAATPVATLDVRGGIAVSGWSNNNGGTNGGVEFGWDGAQSLMQSIKRTDGTWQPIGLNGSYTKIMCAGSEVARFTSAALSIGGAAVSGGSTSYDTIDPGKIAIATGTNSTIYFVQGATSYAGYKLKVGAGNNSGGVDNWDHTIRPSYASGVATGGDRSWLQVSTPWPSDYPDVNLVREGGRVRINNTTGLAGLSVPSRGWDPTTGSTFGYAAIVTYGGYGGGINILDSSSPTAGTGYGLHTRANGADFYIQRQTVGSAPTGGGVYISNNGGSWSSVSDERVKDIIEPITNASEKVSSLRAVIGKFKTDEEDVRRVFLIAQDVQKVLPEAVNEQDDELRTLGLQYTDVVPLLVAAIKELTTANAQLKARLDAAGL